MEQIPSNTAEFEIYPAPPLPDTSVPDRADPELHNAPYKSYGKIIPTNEVNDTQETEADGQNHTHQLEPMVSLPQFKLLNLIDALVSTATALRENMPK